jgi:serine protease AprX
MKSLTPKPFLILLILFFCSEIQAGTRDRVYKFWVELTDKKDNEYSLLRPWDFLSSRAIARRERAGSGTTLEDLPVTQKYINAVGQTGVKVLLASRWMNAVLVSTTDSALSIALKELYFVKNVSLMGIWNRKRGMAETAPDAVEQMSLTASEAPKRIEVGNKVKDEDYHDGYGLGWKQISQINGQYLHQQGYKGSGIRIAVLDAGFYRADRMAAFDSLFQTDRYLGSVDLIDRGTGVFEDDDHGTNVLSCLASYAPGVMIGTAPEASYMLIRTEDAGSETPSEEVQWLCGVEYADSAGIDMISSSLGYTEFDDSRFGHKYEDLDGHTTLITRAANMAWDRGMIVVNSAGNEGDEKWKHIGAPADAAGVIAVGAVDEDGNRAAFSSIGPTADGRVKPDLMALGKRTTIINSNGYYIRSNGTSYSAPVLAGAVACFLQAAYANSPVFVRKMIMLSSQQYLGGNNHNGSGLPDFKVALGILHGKLDGTSTKAPFLDWPNGDTLTQGFDLKTMLAPGATYMYKLKNAKGKTLVQGSLYKYEGMVYAARIEPTEAGEYVLEVSDEKEIWKSRFYFAPIKEKKK